MSSFSACATSSAVMCMRCIASTGRAQGLCSSRFRVLLRSAPKPLSSVARRATSSSFVALRPSLGSVIVRSAPRAANAAPRARASRTARAIRRDGARRGTARDRRSPAPDPPPPQPLRPRTRSATRRTAKGVSMGLVRERYGLARLFLHASRAALTRARHRRMRASAHRTRGRARAPARRIELVLVV